MRDPFIDIADALRRDSDGTDPADGPIVRVDIDRSRRTGNIAVSDSRSFYTTSEFPVYNRNVAGGPVPLPLRSSIALALKQEPRATR